MSANVEPAYVGAGQSFEELYRAEYPSLLGVARALTGDRADSEDLVQDTMVRAFLNWRKVGSFQRPGAWCLRVLTNLCRSRWRRRWVANRWLERQRSTSSHASSQWGIGRRAVGVQCLDPRVGRRGSTVTR